MKKGSHHRQPGNHRHREVRPCTAPALDGGRDSVETFLEYCEPHGFHSPESDGYGWAHLTQIVCNFFRTDGLSYDIHEFSSDCESQ